MEYDRDTAHCMGTGCPIRNDCVRHEMYLQWLRRLGKAYFEVERYENGECVLFVAKEGGTR
jgi:hypothetical protein